MVEMFDISKNKLFDNAIFYKVVPTQSVFKTLQTIYTNNIDSICLYITMITTIIHVRRDLTFCVVDLNGDNIQ